MSDGSILNKYDLKVLNKTDRDIYITASVSGIEGMTAKGMEKPLLAKKGHTSSFYVFLTAPVKSLDGERMPVVFRVENKDNTEQSSEYESMFFGPRY